MSGRIVSAEHQVVPNRQLSLFAELREPAPELLPLPGLVTEGSACSWATFSADKRFRYLLGRRWQPAAAWLVVGMHNPSRADAERNDATVTRLVGFAQRDGFGGVLVWNLGARIATSPERLCELDDPVGPLNWYAIQAACSVAATSQGKCAIAWGCPVWCLRRVVVQAHQTAARFGPLWRFGATSKAGFPRHPLYLAADTPLVRCDGRR
jgi:hypothetical protein